MTDPLKIGIPQIALSKRSLADSASGLARTRNFDEMRRQVSLHLHSHILPFWTENAMDEDGGINTCIANDGTLLSRDKFLWGQWRAVWVFARLFRLHGEEPRHLEAARRIAEFSVRNGWDPQSSGWRLILHSDGREKEGCTSIYTDGFAMYALDELYRATGEDIWRDWAVTTADSVLRKLQLRHCLIPHSPYPVPEGARVHGIPMIFSHAFAHLGETLSEERYLEKARELSDEVFESFYRPEAELILERIADDGGIYPGALGSAVNPGHVIEDMWFQIEIARQLGRESRIPLACRLVLRHLEFGWDEAFDGGLLLARDAHGGSEVGWEHPNMKLWWPHTEALYAVLLCYHHSKSDDFLAWYARLWEHCLRFYCDWTHGEWKQKLNRNQAEFDGNVVYPVKDPFHLPRSLILQIELLEAMSGMQVRKSADGKPHPESTESSKGGNSVL